MRCEFYHRPWGRGVTVTDHDLDLTGDISRLTLTAAAADVVVA